MTMPEVFVWARAHGVTYVRTSPLGYVLCSVRRATHVCDGRQCKRVEA